MNFEELADKHWANLVDKIYHDKGQEGFALFEEALKSAYSTGLEEAADHCESFANTRIDQGCVTAGVARMMSKEIRQLMETEK